MIKKEELQMFANNNYTIKKILIETNYTYSQVRYACEKYNIKLLSNKRKFVVDKNKVKVLLEYNFSISEIARILNVNTRCIYNIMYRNKWTKKRTYIKSTSKKKPNYTYGINVEKEAQVKCVLTDNTIIQKSFIDLFGQNIKSIVIIK